MSSKETPTNKPSAMWRGLGSNYRPRLSPQTTDPDAHSNSETPQLQRARPLGKIPNLSPSPPELTPGDKDEEYEDGGPATPSPLVHALAKPGKLIVTGRAEGRVGRLSVIDIDAGTPTPEGARELSPLVTLTLPLSFEDELEEMINQSSETPQDEPRSPVAQATANIANLRFRVNSSTQTSTADVSPDSARSGARRAAISRVNWLPSDAEYLPKEGLTPMEKHTAILAWQNWQQRTGNRAKSYTDWWKETKGIVDLGDPSWMPADETSEIDAEEP